jgi:putative transposase
VVAVVIGGEGCRVAARFGVAVFLTGDVVAALSRNRRKPVLDPHRAFSKERISQTTRLTFHKLKDGLAARGVNVSHNAVWMFLRPEGLKSFSLLNRPAPMSRAGASLSTAS